MLFTLTIDAGEDQTFSPDAFDSLIGHRLVYADAEIGIIMRARVAHDGKSAALDLDTDDTWREQLLTRPEAP